MNTTDQANPELTSNLYALDEGAVNAVLGRLDDLPAMPLSAAEILRLTKTPEVEIKEIEKVINTDPALAAKVLRIANSAFYGLRVPVSTLSHALMVLGLYQLRSVVIAAAYRGLYAKVPPIVEGLLNDLWRHSFVTGVVSRELAKLVGLPQMEECFVAGLLHDIGQLVLARRFPEEYSKLFREAEKSGIPKSEVEKSRWGIDHTMIGGVILDRWKIAPGLTQYIRFHHDPLHAPEEDRRFCAVLYVADRFDRGVFQSEEDLSSGEHAEIVQLCGADPAKLWGKFEDLKEHIDQELNSIQSL